MADNNQLVCADAQFGPATTGLVCPAPMGLCLRRPKVATAVSLPGRIPYPDEFLIAAHDWLNQLNPVFAGKIKFEGDYYTVLLIMNVIVMIAFILFGAIAGYVFRNGGLVAAWRSVVQRSSP